jgi:VWFA-related protein
MTLPYLSRPALALVVLCCVSANRSSAQSSSQPQSPAVQTEAVPPDTLTIHKTVRQVIVDVVVRDSNDKPVHGLTAKDFLVAEDNQPQKIVSFDVHDFETASISLGPNGPHPAVNNFVNIPTAPERGPLYVILYDLVNMGVDDQIDARKQTLKFINSKPAGTRFAIFVRSDGLYLVQGFTEDKQLLFAALDPQNPKAHVPRIFLMGRNLGYGDPVSVVNVMTQITEFLEGLPGHKNLMWMASTFPLALVPRKDDPREYEDDIKKEINGLTRAEVAVYPVNVGGVIVNPPGALTGAGPNRGVGGAAAGPVGTAMGGGGSGAGVPNDNSHPDATGVISAMRSEGSGDSTITDYAVQRSIANMTGGRAFYSTNDVTAVLTEATEDEGTYYSLSYSPTYQKDDGSRRSIEVKLQQKGYHLSYRRFYFANAFVPQGDEQTRTAEPSGALPSAENDTLQPNMKHGAPMIHDLLFAAHVHADGKPAMATPEQMSQLADQPAYFRTRHNDKPLKPLSPIELQSYAIDYRVNPTLKVNTGKPPTFEFAAAAFDADGHMLNGIVNDATGDAPKAQDTSKSGLFRVRQQLDVPAKAAWIRIGVRDKLTNRMGTLEVQLPLAPEPATPSVTSAR